MTVSEFLEKHGFQYRRSGGEQLVVHTCPICGDDESHFYIHKENGLWDCKKCFTGDTEISLVNGTEVPIQELVGRDPFWVYSYDHESGKIVPGKATARKTRENAELVEVELDNGEKVKCTPDHRWMLRDGSYRQAQDLQPGDSLMPLYRMYDNKMLLGYELLRQPYDQKWHFTHRQFAVRPKPEGTTTIHHRNLNKRDNRTENLQWMSAFAHLEFHHKLKLDDIGERIRAGHARRSLEAERNRVLKMKWTKAQQRSPELAARVEARDLKYRTFGVTCLVCSKQFMLISNAHLRVHGISREEYLRRYPGAELVSTLLSQHLSEKSNEGNRRRGHGPHAGRKRTARSRQKQRASWAGKPAAEKAEVIRRRVATYKETCANRKNSALNHRVVAVYQLSSRRDVYDLSVERFHNFALTVGVFVHNCLNSGNLWTLKREVESIDPVASVTELLAATGSSYAGVDEDTVLGYSQALASDSSTIDWLLKRGISRDSIRRFRLGLFREDGVPWLAIPYLRDGHPVNIKFRKLPPYEKSFRLITGCETPLYNIDGLDPSKPVYVCEGELDAMLLVQQGYENTVSVPLGAGSFAPEHFDALVVCGRIYLVFDADAAGAKGASDVSSRLGPERCFTVKLPVNDVTDFFQRFETADFEGVLAEAQTTSRPSVLSISDTFRELAQLRSRQEAGENEIRFPWRSVDRIVGALQPGWLVVLQGAPFVGKSTFCLNALAGISRQTGSPSLLYCLEMTPTRLLARLISSCRSVPENSLSSGDIAMARAELHKVPLYFGRAPL